jgi:outer membrane receptor protein involved in Fe transport
MSTNSFFRAHARRQERRTAAALLSCLAGIAATVATAQETPAESDEGATVVITGSRIRRTDLEAPSPVAVVSQEQIRDSGNATIENTLAELPQIAAGMNSQTNANGGPNGSASGVLSANLRALGATRTLVLVNGRRYISANQDGIVDLASIPDMLVDHVEVMTGGASAVYGSDAIAGAVNFILKKDLNGIEASYLHGQTSESDGRTDKIDLAMGTHFADGRGNVLAYGSYTQRDAIMFANRSFSATSLNEGPDGLIPGGSGNIPGTKIALGATQLASVHGVTLPIPGSAGCTNLGGVRFGEGGEVLPYCTPQDLYNFAPDNYLQRPLSRAQLSTLASYEFAKHVEVYSELFYVDTRNAFQQAPQSGGLNTPGVSPAAFVVPDYGHNPILLAPVRQFFIDNPQLFDPDGVYNNDPAHPELDTAFVPGTGRRGTETGPRHNDYERTSLNMTGGLRGSFAALGRDWQWDSFFQYQRSRTDQLTEGVYSQTRLGLGADVVIDAQGNASCRVGNAFGCVPVNPFGIGSITPDAGKFIATEQTSKEVFERRVAGASVTGNLLDLPAGPVGAAVGLEWRKDEYNFLPGATDLAGEYGPDSRGITAGQYDVTEYFAEFRVPILAGKPFVKALTLELAGRSSDYSTFGTATTWKAGFEWAPVDALRFRSAFNRALRSPTVGELFAPISNGFTGATDPCDIVSHPTDAQKALCVQQGVPQGDIDTFTSTNQGFGSSSGGNPNLTPEQSDTFTVGAVVQVPGVSGLNLTLDYFDIEVDNAIATIDAQKTLNGCFTLLDNGTALCQSIHRTAGNGQIDFVTTQLANIGQLKVTGLDFQADYSVGLPSALAFREHAANLGLTLAISKLFERSTQVQGFPADDCAGFIGSSCSGQDTFAVPDIKATLGVRWSSGPLALRAQARYIAAMDIFPGTATVVKGAPAQTYVDLNGVVSIGKSVQILAGVDNLLDKQPPLLGAALGGDANTDTSLYDIIGRRYFLSMRVQF